MAKVGFWLRGTRGKLAGASFSKGENGQTIARQIVTPTNPKTAKQADQRSKIAPAAHFYKAFRNILNHSFLPLEPERKNRRKFMSYALRADMPMPLELKGSRAVPHNVPYLLSLGSLPQDLSVAKPGMIVDRSEGQVATDMFGFTFDNISLELGGDEDLLTRTIAVVSNNLIEVNSRLEEGMEITVLAVVIRNYHSSKPYAEPAWISFVLNTLDTREIKKVCHGIDLWITDDRIGCRASNSVDDVIAACGLIVSKKTEDGWDYTPSTLVCNGRISVDASVTNIAVRQSYMNAASSMTSDQILQQAYNSEEESEAAPRPMNVVNYPFTLRGEVANVDQFVPGQKIACIIYSDGSFRPLTDDDDNIVLLNENYEGIYTAQYIRVKTKTGEADWALLPFDYLQSINNVARTELKYTLASSLGGAQIVNPELPTP